MSKPGTFSEVARILEEYEAEIGDYIQNANDDEEEALLQERQDVVSGVRRAYLEEFGQTVCHFCRATVDGNPTIPLLDDDEGWARLGEDHEPWCQWIEARAFRSWGRS